jgi:hypothetical protein
LAKFSELLTETRETSRSSVTARLGNSILRASVSEYGVVQFGIPPSTLESHHGGPNLCQLAHSSWDANRILKRWQPGALSDIARTLSAVEQLARFRRPISESNLCGTNGPESAKFNSLRVRAVRRPAYGAADSHFENRIRAVEFIGPFILRLQGCAARPTSRFPLQRCRRALEI